VKNVGLTKLAPGLEGFGLNKALTGIEGKVYPQVPIFGFSNNNKKKKKKKKLILEEFRRN
jgi:hypothetical protein